jgi:hypothetical protein
MASLRSILVCLLVGPLAAAAEPPAAPAPPGPAAARPNALTGNEITPRQREVVEKGLAWLAAQQDRSGSYRYESGTGHAGITALAGVAFMSAGNLPNRGKYGANVRLALQYVMSCCQESGLISSDATSPMYGHGFATLFLGEIFGMTPDEDVKEKLIKAVRLIERTQNSAGGWRYNPIPQDADISVTICQVMGLRAARDAGIKVSKDVIDNAIKYVRRCQNADGGFSYQAGQGSGSGFARTAAGVAALYYAGVFEGNDLQRGEDYLKAAIARPGAPGAAEMESMYYYGNYYAAQAMFLAGGEYWEKYYPWIREELIRRQTAAGSWSGEAGDHYATAMALIILQMPNRYLPVFHGKGPGQ